MNEEYRVIELEDDSKWFIASEIDYNNEKYQYLLGINDTEDDFIDEYKVMKVSIENNETYYDIINDTNLLKELIPLLVPEAKEYIDNPEKMQELINQN